MSNPTTPATNQDVPTRDQPQPVTIIIALDEARVNEYAAANDIAGTDVVHVTTQAQADEAKAKITDRQVEVVDLVATSS